MNSTLTESTTPSTRRSRNDFWCYECSLEITPLMVPDPLCPRCHSAFVEKIELHNDPRTFVQLSEDNEDGSEGEDENEPGAAAIQRLLQLFQSRTQIRYAQSQPYLQPQSLYSQSQSTQNRTPGDFPNEDVSIMFNPDSQLSSPEIISAAGLGQIHRDTRYSISSSSSFYTTDEENVEMTDALDESYFSQFGHVDEQELDDDDDDDDENNDTYEDEEGDNDDDDDEQEQEQEQQNHNTAGFVTSLLEQLGFEFPDGLDSDEGPFSGLINMFSNPGDYVFSDGALDDVITHIMDGQNHVHQDVPIGASDETIDGILRRPLTTEEIESNTECSVCKDEFTIEETCLQLKCKHVFHEECIKRWLKMNATCPTCRFHVVSQNGQDESIQGHSHSRSNLRGSERSGSESSGSEPRFPGSFPSSPTRSINSSYEY
ncbi:hypothetical protein BGZ76_002316 [Entomortierella beljakovae]|nr:hypothetical protein BGZ76_002316 [Entomortierella beljakovae]